MESVVTTNKNMSKSTQMHSAIDSGFAVLVMYGIDNERKIIGGTLIKGNQVNEINWSMISLHFGLAFALFAFTSLRESNRH